MAKDVFQYYEDYISKEENKEKVDCKESGELSERLGKVEQAIASVNTLLEKMIEKEGEENAENINNVINSGN